MVCVGRKWCKGAPPAGRSYAAGEACGDPHAEAWAVLTHRKGLQARVQVRGEAGGGAVGGVYIL